MLLHVIYGILALFGLLGEITLAAVLLIRREYKIFPIFTLYIVFNTVSDLSLGVVLEVCPLYIGRFLEFSTLPLTYLLELGVLFEIAATMLRPVQPSIPRRAMQVFGILLVLCLAVGGFLAWHVPSTGNRINDLRATMNLTVGFLRLLVFAATAGFAQLLGIGWKNKVLRLATALSAFSAVDLMVTLLQRHLHETAALNAIRASAYVFELGFLVWAFTTKDVRRREFSPQMEQFLVTLSGRARVARATFARTVK